jgi:uncharacterized iron-regulated protein
MKLKGLLNAIIMIIFLILVIFISFTNNSNAYTEVLRLSDNKIISFEEMLEELKTVDLVFIGEDHDNEEHHRAQFQVIKGMKERGNALGVGFEMFLAQEQKTLDMWAHGTLGLESFLKTYYDYWRLPWTLYSKIFLYSKDNNIPMLGLNVPKEITRKVSQDGFSSLSDEELKKLPPGITCDDLDERYMEFIKQAYDVHEEIGDTFVYFCEAQMVWDKAMAWHLIQYLTEEKERTMVILAGIGHSWKKGIPAQIKKQSNYTFKVVLPETSYRTDRKSITTDDADYLLLG